MHKKSLLIAGLLLVCVSRIEAGGPRVDVVIGTAAPALERFAARELAGQLKQLFQADVRISAELPDKAAHVILLGSPATNDSVKNMLGEQWPKLTDQAHLLR